MKWYVVKKERGFCQRDGRKSKKSSKQVRTPGDGAVPKTHSPLKPHEGLFFLHGEGVDMQAAVWGTGSPLRHEFTDDKAEGELETGAPLLTKAAALWGSTTRRLRRLHVQETRPL